jgi:hypothetical protein
MILIKGCISKPSYALNDFGVYICETTPTAKWFRIEMWRGQTKKYWGAKVIWGVREIWGVHENFGVREKFGGCTSNLGGALNNLCMVHKDDLCIITKPILRTSKLF